MDSGTAPAASATSPAASASSSGDPTASATSPLAPGNPVPSPLFTAASVPSPLALECHGLPLDPVALSASDGSCPTQWDPYHAIGVVAWHAALYNPGKYRAHHVPAYEAVHTVQLRCATSSMVELAGIWQQLILIELFLAGEFTPVDQFQLVNLEFLNRPPLLRFMLFCDSEHMVEATLAGSTGRFSF